nr:hypothetical protein [Tanacetum cinerariifolium]
MVPFVSSISPKGFLPLILLLVVIITRVVVIVVVVVVVGGVPLILKLSFMVIDGVESKRYHIVPYEELDGVLVALVASFGVVSKSSNRILVSHGG